MFRFFKRKEDIFQKLIEEQASITYEALRLLVKYLETLDAEVAERLSIKEKEADEVRRILRFFDGTAFPVRLAGKKDLTPIASKFHVQLSIAPVDKSVN